MHKGALLKLIRAEKSEEVCKITDKNKTRKY